MHAYLVPLSCSLVPTFCVIYDHPRTNLSLQTRVSEAHHSLRHGMTWHTTSPVDLPGGSPIGGGRIMFMLPPSMAAGGPKCIACLMIGGPAMGDMMATLLTGGAMVATETGTAATVIAGRG